MKEHLKQINQITHETVDPETGEYLTETKIDKILIGESGEFYQLYSSVISVLEELKPIEAKIFISTFRYATNENIFALSKPLKETIAKNNNCCYSAVANAITTLVRKGLLIRRGNNTYRLNPRYFWKSNSSDRRKTLKVVLEFECPNC